MNAGVDFSIIIPQRNSIHTLPRLFGSIPVSDRIEIILVDNSPVPITKEEIGIEREYVLLWADPERYAGGARNVGIENARGKWLLFADADDYYQNNAFDVFYSNLSSDADVVFFGVSGIFLDTGQYSTRGKIYSDAVKNFVSGESDEKALRLRSPVPWAKMVKKSYLDKQSFRFDEVPAGNDVYFSLLVGYYAEKIAAVDEMVYCVTVNRGSLTNRKNLEILKSRYIVTLRYNKFVREHQLNHWQKSVVRYIVESCRYGFIQFLIFLRLAFRYRQNLFVNSGHWMTTFKKILGLKKEYSRYIVRS